MCVCGPGQRVGVDPWIEEHLEGSVVLGTQLVVFVDEDLGEERLIAQPPVGVVARGVDVGPVRLQEAVLLAFEPVAVGGEAFQFPGGCSTHSTVTRWSVRWAGSVRPGDNAARERFLGLLQHNVLNQRQWATREEPRIAIVTWIQWTYHRRRRQQRLGTLTPIEDETMLSPAVTQGAKQLSPLRAADPSA